MKLNFGSIKEIRQGVPQHTDDSELVFVEVVCEEQRSIMMFIESKALLL